ncbi:hypothetical protein CRM22_008271 [Opisthorchis felineus]|uniref:Uncharacterized protein n=1 Tax=Opisthorchis felineus TaxID=147828 RepID=A0A4S2LJV7_OPIFE|nr:hypothetical protein CRM22_008271 [Opisthorchis felineus]
MLFPSSFLYYSHQVIPTSPPLPGQQPSSVQFPSIVVGPPLYCSLVVAAPFSPPLVFLFFFTVSSRGAHKSVSFAIVLFSILTISLSLRYSQILLPRHFIAGAFLYLSWFASTVRFLEIAPIDQANFILFFFDSVCQRGWLGSRPRRLGHGPHSSDM